MPNASNLPTDADFELHDDSEDREELGFSGDELLPAWREAVKLLALHHRKALPNPHLAAACQLPGFDLAISQARVMLAGCEASLTRARLPDDSSWAAESLRDALIVKAGDMCGRAGFSEPQARAMAAEAIAQLMAKRLAAMERGSAEALASACLDPGRIPNDLALFPLAAELAFGPTGSACMRHALRATHEHGRMGSGFRLPSPEFDQASGSWSRPEHEREHEAARPPPLARHVQRVFSSLTRRGLGPPEASHLGGRETAIALAMCRLCDALPERLLATFRLRSIGRSQRVRELFVEPLLSLLEARAMELATQAGEASSGSARRSL